MLKMISDGEAQVGAVLSAIISLIVIMFISYIFIVYIFPAFAQLPGGNFITDNWLLILLIFGVCIFGGVVAILLAIKN